MLAIQLKGKSDFNVWFSDDRRSGVLIQPKFRRAIFFVNGETKDNLDYTEETTASEIDRWIKEKRSLFIKEN